MATKYSTLRIDRDTRDRLSALSALIGKPMTEVVATLSHGDLSTILDCTARKAIADQAPAVLAERAARREAAAAESRNLDNAGDRGNE